MLREGLSPSPLLFSGENMAETAYFDGSAWRLIRGGSKNEPECHNACSVIERGEMFSKGSCDYYSCCG